MSRKLNSTVNKEMLAKFPWLWAIRSRWHGTNLFLTEKLATPDILTEIMGNNMQYWIKMRHDRWKIEEVLQIKEYPSMIRTKPFQLISSLMQHDDFILEAIVTVTVAGIGGEKVFIYSRAKGGNLHKLYKSLVKADTAR